MICPTCHGDTMIWSGPFNDGHGLRAGRMIPCPNPLCHAGEIACCDGLTAENEVEGESDEQG